jgi:cytidyltransferase-like protein
MATKSRSLESFIHRIYYPDPAPFDSPPIFSCSCGCDSNVHLPILKSDRTNRILLMSGCFNPAHRGHFELLKHGFLNCGRDLNIIAVIVVLPDDNILLQKTNMVFTRSERTKMLNGGLVDGCTQWAWIFDRPDSEWELFRDLLIKDVKDDGFDLTWVDLQGSDHVVENAVPKPSGWVPDECSEIHVSDVGRPTWFTYPKGECLGTLIGCHVWETVVVDYEACKRAAEERAREEGLFNDIMRNRSVS